MATLFPSMVDVESFSPGDCVRKFESTSKVTPYTGIVTHIVPATYKVWVQWPLEVSAESPETLVRVNPEFFGMPSAIKDKGYNSYEKNVSEQLYGRIPKAASSVDKMAIRVAHTFATDIIGKLVTDIAENHKNKLSDTQAYYRIFKKYSNICSDSILKTSIKKVYAFLNKE
jgi:hypothetical protein